MLRKQAKVVSPGALRRLLTATSCGPHPERDRVMVLLSVRAGLRACEIANLTWAMVLNADGRVGPVIEVRATIAKKRSGRRVPIHPQLARALAAAGMEKIGIARLIAWALSTAIERAAKVLTGSRVTRAKPRQPWQHQSLVPTH